ncbi:hypothetical protein D3C76_1585520 [compost metagenome]
MYALRELRTMIPALIGPALLMMVENERLRICRRDSSPREGLLLVSVRQAIVPEFSRMNRTLGRTPSSIAGPPKKISVSSA